MRDLRSLFNKAAKEYNNKSLGIIRVTHCPFDHYEIVRSPKTKKRNIAIGKICKVSGAARLHCLIVHVKIHDGGLIRYPCREVLKCSRPGVSLLEPRMETSSKSAAYWVSEFQKGNPSAFSYVFDLHYRSLCYYAATMLDDIAEVEDTVSEVFVKLWQRAANFSDLNGIKGFLYICTKNRCLDRLKQQNRHQASLSDYANSLDALTDGEDYALLETEVLVLVYDEIEQLPAKARTIFKLIFFEGLKTDEVAARLGISVKTVRNQKARAIRLLQTALLKKGLPAFIWVFCCLWSC